MVLFLSYGQEVPDRAQIEPCNKSWVLESHRQGPENKVWDQLDRDEEDAGVPHRSGPEGEADLLGYARVSDHVRGARWHTHWSGEKARSMAFWVNIALCCFNVKQ